MSQTSVIEQGVARSGLLADLGLREMLSFSAETAIPFGLFVVRGTDMDKQCKLPAAATDVTDRKKGLGVAVALQTLEVPLMGTADPQYLKDFTVAVLTFGRIWVPTEDDATDESKSVYVRHTVDAALTKIGGFSASAGAGLSVLSNARWMGEDVTVDGTRLAQLEVRL